MKTFFCTECEFEFDSPKEICESHGEPFGYCPKCGGEHFYHRSDLICPICGGMKRHPRESYCEECKTEFKDMINGAIVDCNKEFGDSLWIVADTMQNIIQCDEIGYQFEKNIAMKLAEALIGFSYERGCSIPEAWDVAEVWSNNKL